jgi:hypothetical protein
MIKAELILTAFKADVSSEELKLNWTEQISRTVESWSRPEIIRIGLVTNGHVDGTDFVSKHKLLKTLGLEIAPQGALATAVLGLGLLQEGSETLIVAAGDTEVFDEVFSHIDAFARSGMKAGVLVCTSSDDSRDWSFAHLDGTSGELIQVTEREQPSALKTAGVFLFSDSKTFLDAAEWCFLNHISHQDSFYTSSTINFLLSRGQAVYVGEVSQLAFQKAGRRP